MTDCINKPIYQELIDEDEYFESKSDERIYLDLRASFEYANEVEKLERNESKINLPIYPEQQQQKKTKIERLGLFCW